MKQNIRSLNDQAILLSLPCSSLPSLLPSYIPQYQASIRSALLYASLLATSRSTICPRRAKRKAETITMEFGRLHIKPENEEL
jgi:hypothetical protein